MSCKNITCNVIYDDTMVGITKYIKGIYGAPCVTSPYRPSYSYANKLHGCV